MRRIDTPNREVDLFGPGKDGFRNGNLALGVAPTEFNAEWVNAVQEELMSVVEAGGLVPDGGDYSQMVKAIRRMSGAKVATVTAGATLLTADDAGLVFIDASGGDVTLTLPAANAVINLPIGFTFYRTDNSANAVTIQRSGADTIDGNSSFSVGGQATHRSIRSDSQSAWMTITESSKAPTSRQFSLSAAVAANALTITLNHASIDFRSPVLAIGVPNTRTSAAPVSLVVPSGATLGTANGVVCRLLVLAIDNAGAIELAVVNLQDAPLLDEMGLISTTQITAAADNTGVIYSAVARANVPYRVVGMVECTQAAAGTWATAPTTVQGAGGITLAILASLGYTQKWQSVTRSPATNYTNTTGRPIMLNLYASSASGTAELTVAGVIVGQTVFNSSGKTMSAVIPPGAVYSYTGPLHNARELR